MAPKVKRASSATLKGFNMRYLFWVVMLNISLFTHDIVALSIWDKTPYEIRDQINQQIMKIEASVPPVLSVVEKEIQYETRKTPIRIYIPNNSRHLPIILFIHGGAWVAGSLDTHDNLARYLCSETNALVVSVGYLNCPEGKFPLPMEQSYDALTWITEHGSEFSADVSRLAIVGDSAGGCMTAALCLMARDRQGPKIDLQVLINPVTDLTCQGTLERQNDALDVIRWQALQYVSDPKDANHCYVSPFIAGDLSHLPAAVVLLAEKDPLREDGQRYADRLLSAGVPTFVYCQKELGHLAGHGARASTQARESLDVAIDALKKSFFKDIP
jgi:acetyl esterase